MTDHERTFFGSITAGICHEVNNVLAIAGELAGLQGDLLTATGEGRPLDPRELSGITGRIAGQMTRGKDLVQMLRSFAHSMDRVDVDLDVGGDVHQVVELCQRFARLRRTVLVASSTSSVPRVRGCSFDLQHLVFRCIDAGLATAGEGDEVAVELGGENGRARLRIGAGGESATQEEAARKLAVSRAVADRLGAAVELENPPGGPSGAGPTLTLRIPAVINRSLGHEERSETDESS